MPWSPYLLFRVPLFPTEPLDDRMLAFPLRERREAGTGEVLYVLEPAVLAVNPRTLSCVNLHMCWNLSSLGLTATLHSQAHLKADP